jgi:hypothetical protein
MELGGARIMRRIIGAVMALVAISSSAFASDYYKVQVTRKDQDLYEVVGEGIYIKTRFCFEFVFFEDAIVKIDSPAGFNIGEIIFVESGSAKCDIEKILR